jgi:hypothetical protein
MRSIAKTLAGSALLIHADAEPVTVAPTRDTDAPTHHDDSASTASSSGASPGPSVDDDDLKGPNGGVDIVEIPSPLDLIGSLFSGQGPKVHHVDQGSKEMEEIMKKNPMMRGSKHKQQRGRPRDPFEAIFGGAGPFGGNIFDGPFGGMDDSMMPPFPFGPPKQMKPKVHHHRLPNGMMVTEVEFDLGGGARPSNPFESLFDEMSHTMDELAHPKDRQPRQKKTMSLPAPKVRQLSDIFPVVHPLFHDIKVPAAGGLKQNLDDLALGSGEHRKGANPMTGSHDSIIDPVLEHFMREANDATPDDLNLTSLFKEVMHMGDDLDKMHTKQHQLEEEKGITGEQLLEQEKKAKNVEDTPEHPCQKEVVQFCSNAVSRLQCLRKLPQESLSKLCLGSVKKSPAFSCATDLKSTGCNKSAQPLACLQNKVVEKPDSVSPDCAATLEETAELLQLVNNTPINLKDAYERQQHGRGPSHSNFLLVALSFLTLAILVAAWILHKRHAAERRSKKRTALGTKCDDPELRHYEMSTKAASAMD